MKQVVYAEMDHAQVMTHAEVTDPYGGTKKTTNVFHFTYQVPQVVRKVYPSTYHGMTISILSKSCF